MCVENCKYLVKDEILKEGVFYDGCIKSKKDLEGDICDSTTSFCKLNREDRL